MTAAVSSVLSPLQSGERLDHFVAQELASLSRTRARDLILSGMILVDGLSVRPSHRVQAGQQIRVTIPDPQPIGLVPEEMLLRIVYEDEDMVVIDKPAGLAVHPAPGHREHTLVHGLLALYPALPGIGAALRPGIVHRLDLDTSGLIMVAKTDRGLRSLASQFVNRSVKKGYLALVKGSMSQTRGLIDAPIARDPSQRRRMAIVARGRAARTRFVLLAQFRQHALVLAMPETGRTHQIRVHFASLGHPIAGDQLYGGEVPFLDRQFLHAALLRFARPSDATMLELASSLPADLEEALRGSMNDYPSLDAVDRRILELVQLSKHQFHAEVV